MRALLISALFWFVLLAVMGSLLLAIGTSVIAGIGYGVCVLGALCLIGSGVVLTGLRRVA